MKVIRRITKKMFQKEVKNCPIPVAFPNQRKLTQCIKIVDLSHKAYNKIIVRGTYTHTGWDIRGFPKKEFICISKNLPIHIKTSILFHEMGHYLCRKNGCLNCRLYLYNTISEAHAFKNELLKSLQNGYLPSLRHSVDYIWDWHHPVGDKGKDLKYHKAARRIVRSPLWRSCVAFLKENGISGPYNIKNSQLGKYEVVYDR